MALSDAFYERARETIARYPQKRSAVIMLLHDAQDEVGYVSAEVIREVARLLDLNSADVAGVATFHTMFKRTPPGRYLISLCTNVSCALRGADETAQRLGDLIGAPHEPTSDGLMSWEPVECLAHCDWAPIAQVNYEDVPLLTPERATELCDGLRAGRALPELVSELRSAVSEMQSADGGGSDA